MFRRYEEPDRRRRRLDMCRLAQQEYRSTGRLRPAMQAARRRQVEHLRVAAQFDNHRRERRQPCRLFGDPKRIGEFRHLRQEHVFGCYAEALLQPRRIGKGRLAKHFRRANPQYRVFTPVPFQEHADKGKRKAGRSTRVARFGTMNFGQSRPRQPAAQRPVQILDACRQQAIARCGDSVMPQHDVWTSRRVVLFKALGKPALDFRDLVAQGKNGSLRRGVGRHDGPAFRQLFLLCSYRFQRRPEESSDSDGEFIPFAASAEQPIYPP